MVDVQPLLMYVLRMVVDSVRGRVMEIDGESRMTVHLIRHYVHISPKISRWPLRMLTALSRVDIISAFLGKVESSAAKSGQTFPNRGVS